MCQKTDCGSISFLVVLKGEERYIWAFRPDQISIVMATACRMALDENLSLTGLDVEVIGASLPGPS